MLDTKMGALAFVLPLLVLAAMPPRVAYGGSAPASFQAALVCTEPAINYTRAVQRSRYRLSMLTRMASGSGNLPSQFPSVQRGSAQVDTGNVDERLRKTPLWRHVKLLEKNNSAGGNAKSRCLYCDHIIPGSYSRVRAHLMRESGKGTSICSAATPEMVEQFRKEEAAARATTEGSSSRSVPMPVQLSTSSSSSGLLAPSGWNASSKKKKQTHILESFHIELQQMADALIARMFYTAVQKKLPFYYVGLTGISVGGKLVEIPPGTFSIDPTTGQGGVIFDSGTTFTMLADPAYTLVRDELLAQMGVQTDGDVCFREDTMTTTPTFPSMVLHFDGGADMDLSAENYFVREQGRHGERLLCWSVLESSEPLTIIGNIMQMDFLVVYDLTSNARMLFRPLAA
ncbi:hypothetical protein ABZP36_014909 [Zizania latifolia]